MTHCSLALSLPNLHGIYSCLKLCVCIYILTLQTPTRMSKAETLLIVILLVPNISRESVSVSLNE